MLINHKKNDVILASGITISGDEVFIEADNNNNLYIGLDHSNTVTVS